MVTGVLIELAHLPFYTDYSKQSTMYSQICTVYTYQCTLYTLILHYITPTAVMTEVAMKPPALPPLIASSILDSTVIALIYTN